MTPTIANLWKTSLAASKIPRVLRGILGLQNKSTQAKFTQSFY